MSLASQCAPEPIQRAVKELWDQPTESQLAALSSSAFSHLEGACRWVYEGFNGSRLTRGKSTSRDALRQALRNFLCWNGSPWHAGETPDVLETAVRLHRTFTQQRVQRTHLVPLDRLCLEEWSSGARHVVRNVSFGPNEVLYLDQREFARLVPVEALARFGPRYEFPPEELAGFYWLVTTQLEDAGPVHRRSLFGLFDRKLSEIGSVRVFRPNYPSPVENALFVLLLTLLKDPNDVPWRPFRVPWVFSFTNDCFADAVSPPAASALSRTIVGDFDHEVEVPDQSEFFDMGAQRHKSLREWWAKLESLLAHAKPVDANFHPLTRHFFVKALPMAESTKSFRA